MGVALIKGMGLGASLMYFFDPDRGRRRRALVADQCTHACHELRDFFGVSTRDLGNRALGLTSEFTRRFRERGTPDDEVLVQRVRATLGRYVSRPQAIEVAARGGQVLLRGPILAGELEHAMRAVADVPGVMHVADQLSIHHGRDIPALQGGRPRKGPQPELLQENLSPAAKLIMGAAGLALALPIVRRAPLTGLALGGAGLILATQKAEGRGAGGGRSSGARGSRDSAGDSGWPGGGRGRIDETGRSGVYPASGPFPPGDAELRTPAEFVRGQYDEQGHPVEGGSELTYMEETLLSDTPQSGPPAGDQGRNRRKG